MVFAFLLGCESEKNDNLNDEPEKRENQIPDVSNQNQVPQQKIEIMTELTPEQEKIKNLAAAVIYGNLEATQDEDVQGVLATLDVKGPQLQSTIKGMEYVFSNYDMVYEIEKLQFISINDEEVKALYQQTTKAVMGTGFTNTRSVGIHILKKSKDGKWKLFKTDYISSEPLR
jgi:hypothetical protein